MTKITIAIGGLEYAAAVEYAYDKAFDEFTLHNLTIEDIDVTPLLAISEFEEYVEMRLVEALEADQ